MTFVDAVRPDVSAPALAPGAIVFRDARHGILVTTGGGRWVPKTAWARPTEPARIQATADGGVHWRTVWSARGIVLTSVAVRGRRIVAAGLRSPTIGGFGPLPTRHVTVATSDGGRTWSVRAHAPPKPPRPGQPGGTVDRRRVVVDSRHSWLVWHANEQGFDSYDVHVTSDGGGHWVRRRVPALPSAFAPGGRAWAVDGETAAVWRTLDEGRTWRISTSARAVGVWSVDVAAPHELVVSTSVGELRSTDGGGTWRAVARPAEADAARREGRLAFVPSTGGYATHVLVRRGATWAALRPPPGFTFGDAWFTDGRHGLVAGGDAGMADIRASVYRTADGGRSWVPVRLPAGTSRDDPAALGPDTIVVEQDGRLSVTVDDGAHWRVFHVPLHYSECLVQRPARTTWILCSDVVDGGRTASLLLRTDGGRSWRVQRSARVLGHSFLATSDDEAWTVGWSGDPVSRAPLWHTVDGGATWRRVAVAPRPDAPVLYRLPLPR